MLRSCSRSKSWSVPDCRLRRDERCPVVEIRARGVQRRIHGAEQVAPARADARQQFAGLGAPAQIDVRGLARLDLAGEIFIQRIEQFELVADRQFDVDALDGVGVFAQPLERNDDVLVDLEGVGVLGDRCGAGAIEPELAARLGAYRDEALAARAHWRGAPPARSRPRPSASSSPTMSPSSTIFGSAPRFDLVL